MSYLVVLAYADEYRAAEVLATLQRFRTGALIRAHDATSIARGSDWSITLHYGGDLRTDTECTGRFWRALIAGVLLAPGSSTRSSDPDGRVLELNAEFVRRLCAALPPGSSAVCLIVPNAALTRILPELRRFGGTLLETPIERAIVARFRGSQLPPADHAADAG